MSVDDQTARLQDAAKHFATGAYPVCLRVLNTCPADDPKVANNTALVQFMIKAGNVRETPSDAALSVPRTAAGHHTAFDYEGHDTACVNTAIMRWHLGDVEGARELLTILAQNGASLSLKAQVRTAALLHITRHAASNQADNDKLVQALLADKASYQSDPLLAKIVQVAFASDTGVGTRQWYLSMPKPEPIDKIMYYNNAGIDAFAQSKHGVAGVLFAKCMALTTAATPGTLCPFVVSSVAFNVALCAVSRGDGHAAAVALSVAQQTMSGSPQYWIRLAQATVLRTTKKMRLQSHITASDSEKQQTSELATNGRQATPASALLAFAQRRPMVTSDVEMRQLLSTIRHACGNVLLLLTRGDGISITAHRVAGSALQFGALISALVYLSWAELQLGNHSTVVKHTTDFFQIYKLGTNGQPVPRSAIAVMLTYAVEALCATNRSAQALRLMSTIELGDVLAETAVTGHAEALFITLCVAHIMNGAWAKAVALANHVVSKFQSRYAQLLLVYIELAQGNREKALDILEKTPILAPDAA